MNRVTLEEVRQAYINSGAVPFRRSIYSPDSNGTIRCCALGALSYCTLGKLSGESGKAKQFLLEQRGLTDSYINGFVKGFDRSEDNYYCPPEKNDEDDYSNGYYDGFAIAKQIFNDTSLFRATT